MIVTKKKFIANQNNIWESLEELGQLYKIQKDYQNSYESYDKALKYFNQLKKVKNLMHFEQQVENRIQIKRNEILKILKHSNQSIILVTETNDEPASDLIINENLNSIDTKNVEKVEETDKETQEKPLEAEINLKEERPKILELVPIQEK